MQQIPPSSTPDAVCFTAGVIGIPFGAGVIHAYLASGRDAPLVAAGISGGALNAAAMQRCYQDLQEAVGPANVEIARWRWYRQYLELILNEPMRVVWDGLPDQSDFFADMAPVKDPTPGLFADLEARQHFQQLEIDARKELYLFVKLGNWLARLPLSMGRVAEVIVSRVRAAEIYPGLKPARWLVHYFHLFLALTVLCVHTAFCPQWFPEHKFHSNGWRRFEFFRPLFGWIFWGLAVLPTILLLLMGVVALHLLYPWVAAIFAWAHKVALWTWERFTTPDVFRQDLLGRLWFFKDRILASAGAAWITAKHYAPVLLMSALGLAGIWIIFAALSRAIDRHSGASYSRALLQHRLALFHRSILPYVLRQFGLARKGTQASWRLRKLTQKLFSSLRLEEHLVHKFHLRIRLTRLFGRGGVSPLVDDKAMAVVLVAAPLQPISVNLADGQVWAARGTSLVDALQASLAMPGLFSPLHVSGANTQHWFQGTDKGEAGIDVDKLDLVDGAVIRTNPIPALFSFLARHTGIADRLLSFLPEKRIHVVYTHPVFGGAKELASGSVPDIVDIGLLAMRLQERRDTELEVEQTNFVSRLEEEIRRRAGTRSADVRNIYADEISPESDIHLGDVLRPDTAQMLSVVSQGCRRTLERIYSGQIQNLANGRRASVACRDLIAVVGDGKRPQGLPTPGLPEVCKGCSGALQVESNRDQKTSATKSEGLVDRFPTLSGEKPRIVLLASGGVFRGPFHAGMLACLLSAQIRPQMIVGASVGTLMGGALGALLTVAEYKQAVALLGNIVDVFLHVDERIAFTKPFKSAMRELGIRGRSIRLSPAQLRKRILRGSRADASFAATGAPAPLIDAIADLAMIPLEETSKIAAEFVSGHVAAAANLLLQQLKVETLQRMDITTAIIGTSLLEPTARTLLGEHMGIELGRQQPFRNIAFFATTSDIRAARSIILGTHAIANGNSYDFVQAALASSAFPCIFSPRRESDIRPGVGNPDSLFSDGGMFDNLPYIPAITVLAGVQREYRKAHALDSVQYLRSRSSCPDLFIVGSLDIRAEIDESRNGPFNNLVAITKRAKLLQNNMKIGAFESSAERIHKQLGLLLGRAGGYQTPSDVQFVDGIVDAATLAVFPSDADHLNPTFAFCRSTGFKPWRVRLSIADGCFQTFAKLVDAAGQPSGSVLGDAMRGLMSDRIPMIERRPADGNYQRGECPFFRHSADTSASHKAGKLVSAGQNGTQAFKCPFYEAWETLSRDDQKHSAESAGSSLGVYHECISDSIHRRAQ